MGNKTSTSRNQNREGSESHPPPVNKKKDLPPTASDPTAGARNPRPDRPDRPPRSTGFSLQLGKGRNRVHPETQPPPEDKALGETVSAPAAAPAPTATPTHSKKREKKSVAKPAEPLPHGPGILKPLPQGSMIIKPLPQGPGIVKPLPQASVTIKPLPQASGIIKPLPRGSVISKPLPRGSVIGKPLPRGSVISKPLPRGSVIGKPLPQGSGIVKPLPQGPEIVKPAPLGTLVVKSTKQEVVTLPPGSIPPPPPANNTLALPRTPQRLLSSEKPFSVAVSLFSKNQKSTVLGVTPSMRDVGRRVILKEMNKSDLNKINETLTRITESNLARAKARADLDIEGGLAGTGKPPMIKIVPGVSPQLPPQATQAPLPKYKEENEVVPKKVAGTAAATTVKPPVAPPAPPSTPVPKQDSGTFLKAPVPIEKSPSFTDPDIIMTGSSTDVNAEDEENADGVPDEGDAGRARALSTHPTTSTISIFLNDWKRQKAGQDVEIIPDPIMKPELVNDVTEKLNILYSIIVFVALMIYGFFYFTWTIIPELYCRKAMLEVFLPPQRMYATMIDMIFVPIFLSFLGSLYANIPDPHDWGCWKLRLNRFLRWSIYFCIVGYMVFMCVTWIMDLTTVAPKLKATMHKSLLAVEIHSDDDLKQIDDSQHYFRCCGVEHYTDWLQNKNAVVIEPNITDTSKNDTYYPWSCCDSLHYPCDVQPTENMVFTEGCYQYERDMALSILGLCVCCEIITIFISFGGFFYVYVLEVLILKVKDPEIVGEIQ